MKKTLTINRNQNKAVATDIYANNQYEVVNRFMIIVSTCKLTNMIDNDNLLSSRDIINLVKKEDILL